MSNIPPSKSLTMLGCIERVALGYYRHYKGGLYHVTDAVLDADEQQYCVVYRSLDGNKYVRRYDHFESDVRHDNGSYEVRFRPLLGYERFKTRLHFFLARFFN